MANTIFLLTGVMASGKSTVAQLLASRLEKAVHLRGDGFRRMIVSGREEMTETPTEEAVRQLQMRYDLTANAAKTYFKNGFSVVIQDNYYGQELPAMLERLKGYPVCAVVLCPTIQTVKAREKARQKNGYTGFEIEKLYAAFMKETPRIGFWLDTSEQSPAQSVNEILSHFHD